MLKRDELAKPGSCWNRAKDDELTFVLLGRDAAAPAAIRAWIDERIRLGKNDAWDAQIRSAENDIDRLGGGTHPMEKLKPREFYFRYEDMSADGKLILFIEDDGDVIVTVYEPRKSVDDARTASAQFCTSSNGGGQSPRVRAALLQLAVAIKEENEAKPQHREATVAP
jgi:hypothetical protein